MQYFQAVQEGKIRSNKAQMRLFEIAGFAMLTLTTKKKEGKFYPVGEEIYSAVIKKPEGYVVLLVDEDGYTMGIYICLILFHSLIIYIKKHCC